MNKRDELERDIIKSATGPDETKFLLSAVDKAVADELEKSDSLLIAEIESLEQVIEAQKIEIDRVLHEKDELSSKYVKAVSEINSLKTAFRRDD